MEFGLWRNRTSGGRGFASSLPQSGVSGHTHQRSLLRSIPLKGTIDSTLGGRKHAWRYGLVEGYDSNPRGNAPAMLKIPCQGPANRREFMRAGMLALGGLSLPEILRAQSTSGDKPATSVILFWMWGGPSQLETWDLKPNAPSEYRGPFSPIATNVPGMDICEIFPRHAKLADKFALIRSLHHDMAAHNDGSIEVLTGKTPEADPTSTSRSEHPDFGMITSKLRPARPDGLPSYVGIPRQHHAVRPTYLGLSHSAFESGNPAQEGYKAPNLSLNAGMDGARLAERGRLAGQLDRFRRDLDLNGSLSAMDEFRGQALELLTSSAAARAFDLDIESPALRDRYGRHLWGQSCLLARRLVEAGTSVVTIDALAPVNGTRNYFSWDDHSIPQYDWDLARGMIWRAGFMEQALGTLIEDIHERGLNKQVLVVALGEFGRTPRLTYSGGCQGRDHWPGAQAALVSGGGLRMGQVIGATSPKAEYPVERPLGPRDLLATIYRHLGIDHHTTLPDLSGRPVHLLADGEPIRELI